MNFSMLNAASETDFDKHHYHQQISHLWASALQEFNKLIGSYIFFNVISWAIIAAELLFFLIFFAFLSQSTLLAFSLAILFMTLFSYFVLKLYFQTKKPEQLYQLCESYFERCKKIIRYQEAISEHHIALGHAAHKFAATLHEKEYGYYRPPPFF